VLGQYQQCHSRHNSHSVIRTDNDPYCLWTVDDNDNDRAAVYMIARGAHKAHQHVRYCTYSRGSGPARRQPGEQVGHISLLISSDGSTHCRQIPVSRSRDSHKSDEPIYLLTYTQ